MKTISSRIVEIKRQLDELEEHVNSTLGILDCKSFPLNEYPSEWKEFKWREYNHYCPNEYRYFYNTEDQTIKALDEHKIVFDKIHAQNEPIIKKNTETFNKICAFLIQLGFSTTTYAHSGTGKRRHSYQTDSEWVRHLKTQYPMVDEKFNSFIDWYKGQVSDIKKNFEALRNIEREKQRKIEAERIEKEEQRKREDEQAMAVNMAIEYLIAHGKIGGRDFTAETAIECSFKLKMELLEQKNKEEAEIKRPVTINALDRMEL